MLGSIDSALAVGKDGMPLRRSTIVSRAYNNHQGSQAWSTSRYTDVKTSNSSTFYTPVNMDWVAYDIADKFKLPAACAKAPTPTLDCLVPASSGPTCTGMSPKSPLKLNAMCLAQLFPEGTMFPAAPDQNAVSAVEAM